MAHFIYISVAHTIYCKTYSHELQKKKPDNHIHYVHFMDVYIHVTMLRNRFIFKQPTRRTNYPNFIVIRLHMFWASSLPTIRSFLLYIRHW